MIKCPCCEYKTIERDYDICEICFWEHDTVQETTVPDCGANAVTLVEAKENYKKFGAVEKRFIEDVRSPTKEEMKYIAKPNTWFDAGTSAEMIKSITKTTALFSGTKDGKPDEEMCTLDEFKIIDNAD